MNKTLKTLMKQKGLKMTMQPSTKEFRPSRALEVMRTARSLGFTDARMEQVSGHVGAVVIGDTRIYDNSQWVEFELAHDIVDKTYFA